MSDSIANFLGSRLPIGGVAAYSIHLPNRVLESKCFSKSLYAISAEEMLNRVVQNSRTLLPAGKASAQYCWTFEVHHVYVAARPGGICLALLVENNPATQSARIQETLQGFLNLTEL
jgi:hypothetical protein